MTGKPGADTGAAAAVVLAAAVLRGERRAVARLASIVENRWAGWLDAMEHLHPHCGRARVIGITGAPGTGKSSLTSALTQVLADRGHKAAVVAIDPSSPLSGGAVLGDRIRMTKLAEAGVFIRSLATRGAMGGLCQAARDVARLLDAAGYDVVLIETVGVGQDEVDVTNLAETVVVVCTPGQGDRIQAIKAGIMEIADVFVVNKSDRPGADDTVAELQQMLRTRADPELRDLPILRTAAVSGEGVAALADTLLSRGSPPPAIRLSTGQLVDEAMLLLRPMVQEALEQMPEFVRANPYTMFRAIIPRLSFPAADAEWPNDRRGDVPDGNSG